VRKVLPDTNLYIDWIDRGLREDLMIGPGMVRYLSAVVVMELRAGAHTRSGRTAVDQLVRAHAGGNRLLAPRMAFDDAGSLLRKLKLAGRDVRSSSFVNDVLIALTAKQIGATVLTSNAADFEAIRQIEAFALEIA
jgi:predicted nucleic acid-binding protein